MNGNDREFGLALPQQLVTHNNMSAAKIEILSARALRMSSVQEQYTIRNIFYYFSYFIQN